MSHAHVAFALIFPESVFFLENLVQKAEVLQIRWNLIQAYIGISLFRV